MATPRKFSEKIAILQRKGRVEEEEFQNVMGAVQQITGSGVSPQTTPSGTPYPCSPTNGPGKMINSAVTTPSAESPLSGLMPDTLMPIHPLSGMPPYARPGGSLPNVHQMVQQNPHQAMLNNFAQNQHQNPAMSGVGPMPWNYWPQAPTNGPTPSVSALPHHGQSTHTRTRSPGSSSHYHPYAQRSSSSTTQRNERASTFNQQMMPDNRLQLPDNAHPRARSDPALHMNTASPCFYNPTFNQPFNQQPQQFYHQQHHPQAWMQMNGEMMPGIGMAAQPPPQQSFYSVSATSATANTHTASSSAGSSASSVPMSTNSPQQSNANCGITVGSGYMKQSPCGSPDMSVVGSLPNMHSPIIPQSMLNHQQSPQHQSPLMQQQYYDYDPQCQVQQTSPPQLHSAPPIMNIKQEPGTYYHNGCNNGVFAPNGYMNQQLNTPQNGQEASQSAPTSPAVGYEQKQPQWTNPPINRHYSASPDSNPIPNIVFTNPDGQSGAGTEFHEYQREYTQDLHNDIQRMRFEDDLSEDIQSQSTYEIGAECEAAILR
ncbi:CREB-regulated transcription coactivator 1 [Aphelenchoides besseyi]|nr:CREB-regulated transcription coactivator 1 [Aphelenchoides besseyi]KAI6207421.1 CREB-regulated transcription coactivator 1 [Aphelenchoides besseyi]